MQFPISIAIHNLFEHVALDSRILFNSNTMTRWAQENYSIYYNSLISEQLLQVPFSFFLLPMDILSPLIFARCSQGSSSMVQNISLTTQNVGKSHRRNTMKPSSIKILIKQSTNLLNENPLICSLQQTAVILYPTEGLGIQ